MGSSEPQLLVGLVTHPRSNYNANGEATARLFDLCAALERRGLRVVTVVSDRDDAGELHGRLTSRELRESALREARLEHRWRRYLATSGGHPRHAPLTDWLLWQGMAVRRTLRARGAVGRRMATRLLNIDLSHLRLLEAASLHGTDWVLILEDDALSDDIDGTAMALHSLISAPALSHIEFVNCSESIALDSLGVLGLFADPLDVPSLAGRVFPAITPVTNTVCSNLYRTRFAHRLASAIRSRGLLPVAPIDWRVNEIIMDLVQSGDLALDSCAWVRPGLFVQQSMHAG